MIAVLAPFLLSFLMRYSITIKTCLLKEDIMLARVKKAERQSKILISVLIIVNIIAWIWAFSVFSHSASLMAACLLAWCYGLRHAVDADHIAAIDNVTRKMMQQNKRPHTIGTWFSLGHSTIVILATIAIAVTATAFKKDMDWFHETGGVIGTLVSAAFLITMAIVNLVILKNISNQFRQIKSGKYIENDITMNTGGGLMSWLFHRAFRIVSRNWHMYLVGFLFGLGFDTATEIGVLGISAASASSGMSIWSILVFPALFTSGMALIDTLDNVIMVGAYGWAFNKPQRKIYYNMTITGTSVIVALFIGGAEALGLLIDKFNLHGFLWDLIGKINDNLGNAGFIIIGVFISCWVFSVINYKYKGYDSLLMNK